MTAAPHTTQALIDALVHETGAADPVAAVRTKAEGVIDLYVSTFGQPEMPLDLLAVASLLGIKSSEAAPVLSEDAELVPVGDGRVEIRVNPDRPDTRRRFSVGHEITHTFFPDYATQVWPRADARYRNLSNPDDYLEMLCDVGAAELVLPRRWFRRDAASVTTAADLVSLAQHYQASREATLRRYAELHDNDVAAVFFTWKLKPTQHGTVGRKEQLTMFGLDPDKEARAARRLRIDYCIPSAPFTTAGHYLPKDKSVENDGPLYEAAKRGRPCGGDCVLDLGQARGTYGVLAVPVWTSDEEAGPNGENAVAAIVRPIKVRPPARKAMADHPRLF